MSAIITILKQANGKSHNIGMRGIYGKKRDSLEFLFSEEVLPIEWIDMHPSSIFRNAEEKGYLSIEVKKGTLREDTPFIIKNETKSTNKQNETTMETTTQESIETKTESTEVVNAVSPEELAKQFTSTDGNNPFAMMAQMIAPYVKPDYKFAAETISQMVSDAISKIRPDKCEVYINDEYKATMGKTHKQFKDILRMTQARVNIWMTGEAGSGKSTIAENVAEALGIEFYTLPCAGDLGKHEVVGYMDAKGEYVSTPFRKAYENGGVFIFEEIDSASPEVVLCVNTALANGGMYFPDGAFIKRHNDFVCLAAANTWGIGASRTYVGRQPMDGASLDRFVQYEIVYDEELELEIAGDRNWARKVQRIRQVVKNSNQRMIISPRASINGAKLLSVGFTEAQVMEMTILKGCSDEQRNIIMSAI